MATVASTVTGQEIDDILDEIEEKESQQQSLEIPDLPLTIIFITGNKGKFNELQSFFGDDIMKYIINYDIDLPEIQGTEKEIVVHKLLTAKGVILEKPELDKHVIMQG